MYCPDFAIYGFRTDQKAKTEESKAAPAKAKPAPAEQEGTNG
jgi:hypothetical protein